MVALCGSGYQVINQRKPADRSGRDAAMVYLLHHTGQGRNRVATTSLHVHGTKVRMDVHLQVEGGSTATGPGSIRGRSSSRRVGPSHAGRIALPFLT
ncbi:hypothetical protein OUY22_21810 [Nonomuraea sp. MCN248]|uniref:Uncharacterized protein n=1 Tax=Nonomuraea corallina TaxID=2989783 RepID=A0ABT4SFT9_9ACTN|nr:hypothetical protein [Nonomuraea corallina]MDA0636067.1 hypothetical protein [Nonomuraea corallina]